MSVTSEADLVRQDAATLSSALSAGDITSVELTQACLNRISAVDGTIHAFLHVVPTPPSPPRRTWIVVVPRVKNSVVRRVRWR